MCVRFLLSVSSDYFGRPWLRLTSTTTPSSRGQVHVDERASPRRQRHRRAGKSTSTTPPTSEQVRDLRPTTTTSTTKHASGWRRHRGPRGPWSVVPVVPVVCSLCYVSTPPPLQTSSRRRPRFTTILADSFDHLHGDPTSQLRIFIAAVTLLEVFGVLCVILWLKL